jgi:hypothetical protein
MLLAATRPDQQLQPNGSRLPDSSGRVDGIFMRRTCSFSAP